MAQRPFAPVIVVTGGTGTGKSTVAAVFRRLGAKTIDVDQLAHQLLVPGTPTWREILKKFCGAVYQPAKLKLPIRATAFRDAAGRALPELPWVINAQGVIRRDRLGATAFSNPQSLKQLNDIMHPSLRRLLNQSVLLHRMRCEHPLVLDIAIYPLRIFQGLGNAVLWVRAPGGLRVNRLVANRRMSAEEASARVNLQWKDAAYRRLADFTLPNLGSDHELRRAAAELWPRLLSRAEKEARRGFL